MFVFKNFALDFVLLVLKLYHVQVLSFLRISFMDKTHHRPVIAIFFCANSAAFLFYVEGVLITNLSSIVDWNVYFGYSANYNTQWEFVILFLISSDLPSCLTSFGTMIITIESGSEWASKSSKSYSMSNSSQNLPFFGVLMNALYGHSRYFTFK